MKRTLAISLLVRRGPRAAPTTRMAKTKCASDGTCP